MITDVEIEVDADGGVVYISKWDELMLASTITERNLTPEIETAIDAVIRLIEGEQE